MSPLPCKAPQNTAAYFASIQSGVDISVGIDSEADYEADDRRASSGLDDDDDYYKDGSVTDTSQGTPTGLDDDFEDKAVRCFRLFVLFVLVAATAAAGACTYLFISKNQQEDFELEFDSVAETIAKESDETVKVIMDDMNSLASSITAIAAGLQTIWPYFTTASFPVIGSNFRHSTAAQLVALVPRVETTDIKDSWQTYSVLNQDWIQQGLLYDAKSTNSTMVLPPDEEIPSKVYRRIGFDHTKTVPVSGPGPFGPLWQMSPAPYDASPVNFDMLSDPTFDRIFHSVEEANIPILSQEMDSTVSLFGASTVSTAGQPTSIMVQPVQFNFDESTMANSTSTQMVATLVAEFLWESFFRLAPYEDFPSVYLVVTNECSANGPFTYAVVGNNVSFVGYGDLHDTQFDSYQATYPFAPFLTVDPGDDDGGISSSKCGQYLLHLYPSSDFYNEYIDSQRAAAITAIVVSIFAAASFIFCCYDCAVHVRQRRILAIAAKSERILSVLYPKTIRDRLFNGLNMIGVGSLDGDNNSKPPFANGGGIVKSSSKGRRNKPRSKKSDKNPHHRHGTKHQLKSFISEFESACEDTNGGISTDAALASKPIADLFPHTTVLFADIAGFTAWSSSREPSQVFTLLEAVYHAFDVIARRRGVFKVETVGDCYVAVTGLPEPRDDHAVVMARFARDCVRRFNDLASSLEVTLGPDTTDLGIRCGMHSGPVTAGVLRGDKSRFQLFGDTVNTAARIESTGKKNRIHLSQETAEQINASGKGGWLKRREHGVEAKGKGRLTTYWLTHSYDFSNSAGRSVSGSSDSVTGSVGSAPPSLQVNFTSSPRIDTMTTTVAGPLDLKNATVEEIEAALHPKIQRLVKWNVDVLTRLLKQIVAKRNALNSRRAPGFDSVAMSQAEDGIRKKFMVLDEVVEIIPLPAFDRQIHRHQEDPTQIELPSTVVDQLMLYVSCIAAMYRENAFHNFEHASHVTMSVSKLLSRIVSTADDAYDAAATASTTEQYVDGHTTSYSNNSNNNNDTTQHNHGEVVHDHTYGITSDPMTHFSVVLAALIHDVDHQGVSNYQLIQEDHELASLYKNKSIAEQNSIVLAWDMLMEGRFSDLRQCIYSTPFELDRFRQLMANTVLATDIFDKDLSALRRNRWNKAFAKDDNKTTGSWVSTSFHDSDQEAVNRKATIVIEHLIQASDVAHTMQHWHVYRKWNERLFVEMTTAYKGGRMGTNPAEGWYKGELGFMDNYVIPLAKKLQECGVFGVSSDEYLNYAIENRREWAANGEDIVRDLIAKYQSDPFLQQLEERQQQLLKDIQDDPAPKDGLSAS